MHVPHCHFFSHPDFTVGFGISPNQLLQFHMVPNDVSSILKQVADYTAGRELHPTPKNFFLFTDNMIARKYSKIKAF